MKIDYTSPIEEIRLRYIIVHSTNDLEGKLQKIFGYVASTSYDIEDIAGYIQSDILSTSHNSDKELSVTETRVLNMPYSSIKEFEDAMLDEDEIFEICKTFDSFKMEENREFLRELYNMEMKIREIYTVLARLQNVNLKTSKVKLLKEYRDNEEKLKRRLMNEFFFIEFSDYKNVDTRKDTKLEDLLDALRQVKSAKDVSKVVNELLHSTLHLEERFNELSRVPEAIGRIENFRNCIAHNRYITQDDVENFNRAKSIVYDIYNDFIEKLRAGEI